MKAPAPCLSLVVLTEDSCQDGRATVVALVRRMLEIIAPGYGSHRVEYIPREPREEEAMPGNLWKTEGRNPVDREKRVRLLRYIVRRLLQPDTFVLFHIDGDRPWKGREKSENVAKFEHLARIGLPQVVDRARAHAPRPLAAPPESPLPLDRLLLVCPFRSIEAWLYQNVHTAIEICRREHHGQHVAELHAWESQRGQLDEEPAPEEVVCLRKRWNLELATRSFPADDAYNVGKSFAATVDRLAGCDALTRALERTRAWP